MKKNNPKQYLEAYSNIQNPILVVYHPTQLSSWRDRVHYKGEGWEEKKNYNHRSILNCEIVIEFDDPKPRLNRKYADLVAERLINDNINYSMWKSGNKSVHVHCLLNLTNVTNKRLLKKVFMRHYSEGLPLPDLQLASDNHLIRMEFGVHEKTGKKKTLITKTNQYPKINVVPSVIWNKYYDAQKIVARRKLTTDVNNLVDNPKLKWILASPDFKQYDDGRERSIFMLCYVLKPSYTEEELIAYLQNWYKYTGGKKLSAWSIANKVRKAYDKTTPDYTFGETYLNELLESIGVDWETIKH